MEQSVRGWHEGQQPAADGTRERRTGQSRWRKNGARTSVPHGRRQSVQQLREHATASTFARLSRCDGRPRVEILRRSGGANFLRASACGCGRADRQNLRRPAQGGRDPGETIPGRTGPSRAGALHHSHLRRAVSGRKGAYRGAAGPDAGYFALAAIPARYAVERRDWQRATELQPRETPFPYTDAITWFARGIAAARLHDAAKAQASVAALQDIRTRLEKTKESYWAGQAEIQRLEVNAWSSLVAGRKDLALTMMKSAAEMEDGTDKKAITPGPLAPARELFGEMLLEINQPAQALEQFEATLKTEPNRFRALYGAARAAQLGGNLDASRKYFAELLKDMRAC